MNELTITLTIITLTLAIITLTIGGFRLYLDRSEGRNASQHLVTAWTADVAHSKLMKGDW